MNKATLTLEATCTMCNTNHYLKVNAQDYRDWIEGAFIQDCMPYLTPEQRELLISRTCGKCFDSLFGVEEDYYGN